MRLSTRPISFNCLSSGSEAQQKSFWEAIMKKLIFSVLFLSLVGLVMVVPASADTYGTIYTSGPVNGNFNYWEIDGSNAVTDSFTLTQAETVTGATLAAWLNTGSTLQSVNWSIGTTQYGAQEGSGTAAKTAFSTVLSPNN